ncbi:MAG: hypothetical protein QOI41_5159, partial [Myxococcales bacterium]|nr:hypothetical protein [Myxococcales bacterium]
MGLGLTPLTPLSPLGLRDAHARGRTS